MTPITLKERIFDKLGNECSKCGYGARPWLPQALSVREVGEGWATTGRPQGTNYDKWMGEVFGSVMSEESRYVLWCQNCVLVHAAREASKPEPQPPKPTLLLWTNPHFTPAQFMSTHMAVCDSHLASGGDVVIMPEYEGATAIYQYRKGGKNGPEALAVNLAEFCEKFGYEWHPPGQGTGSWNLYYPKAGGQDPAEDAFDQEVEAERLRWKAWRAVDKANRGE